MAPIAGTFHLRMGIAIFFALVVPLEPEASATTLELNAPVGTLVVIVTVAGCAMVFLLYFSGLAEATSAVGGCFSLAFPREGATFVASIFFFPAAFGRLLGFFLVASSFLSLTASVHSPVMRTGSKTRFN
jgi:hypothetical protein